MQIGFDPERRLILACASGAPASSELARLAGVGFNWTRVLQTAELNRITGFLYSALSGHPNLVVPADVLSQFKALTASRVLHTLKLQQQLQRILPRFSRANLRVLVLKGMALGPVVYPDLASRMAVDIDLLVDTADLEASDRILRDLGYVPAYDESRQQYYRSSHHHLVPYRLSGTNVQVEVHHNLALQPEYRLRNLDALWRGARQVTAGGVEMLIPGPEHLMLHACLHMALAHSFCGMLRDAIDIAHIIGKYGHEFSWSSFAETVREIQASRPVYYALWTSQSMTGGAVPAALLDELIETRARGLEDRCLKFIIPRLILSPANNTVGRWVFAHAATTLLQPSGTFISKSAAILRGATGAPQGDRGFRAFRRTVASVFLRSSRLAGGLWRR